jgi:PTS system N-acetylglucosamine-specific IIC component
MLLSMALTSFLTGVTEPIEFTFMFLAPLLFAMHAVLTGAAFVVMRLLDVKLGFGFSAGLFDYVLNFGKATRPLMLIPVGLVYSALYYGAFRWAIARFDLKTPGRDAEPATAAPALAQSDRGDAFASALGGSANLESIDACTTRLRLVLVDPARVDEVLLKSLGARGLVRPSRNTLQVVLGPIADQVAGEIRDAAGVERGRPAPSVAARPARPEPVASSSGPWFAALGGRENVLEGGQCGSRIYLTLADAAGVDEAALRRLGVRALARPAPSSLHLLIGPAADVAALARELDAGGGSERN